MIDTVVRVKTHEQYNRLIDILQELGYKWGGGDRVIDQDYFHMCGSKTCIYLDSVHKTAFYGDGETDVCSGIKSFEEFERMHRPKQVVYNARLIEAIKSCL